MSRSAPEFAVLKRVRELCARLPGVTEERDGFGHTSFRVGKRTIAMLGQDSAGVPTLGMKSDLETQEALVRRGGFFRTPYVGQHGWVSTSGTVDELDWTAIEEVLTDTYRAVAPKKLLRELDATDE